MCREIDWPYQWSHYDAFVLDGQRLEDGYAVVGHGLVLYGAAYEYIVIAFAPIGWSTLAKTVDALGEKIKPQVASLPHHLPALHPPFIGIAEKEVGGEAGEHDFPALDFPCLVAFPLDGKVEVPGFPTFAA